MIAPGELTHIDGKPKAQRSVLLIEADHEEIRRIRLMINTPAFKTRNMVWMEGRTPRFGENLYAGLEHILTHTLNLYKKAMIDR